LKWELPKHQFIPGALLIGIAAGVASSGIARTGGIGGLASYALNIVFIMVLALTLILWRFYRDPERTPPYQSHVVLSPADGKVIYIKRIHAGEIPFSTKNAVGIPLIDFIQQDSFFQETILIGIAMNYLNVHINRAPIAGTVRRLNHIAGTFLSLKKEQAVLHNERVFTIIGNNEYNIGLVQIASRLVRQIVPYIAEGQTVAAGDRIGVIRFGSQVDILLPYSDNLEIRIAVGQAVTAGETVLATTGPSFKEDKA
jgi:phosphatidylserine decarboxylase